MRKEWSPLYPPRARWYAPALRGVDVVRRIIWLDRIHLPAGVSVTAFTAALFIPGLAFRLRRERVIAGMMMAAYALLLAVFVLWLGYPIASLAFGLMISLHAMGVLFAINPWLEDSSLGVRLLVGLAVLVVLGGLLYFPALNHVESRWLRPLRFRDQVVIVQSVSSPQSVRRGDWIAYSVASDGGSGWRVKSGFALRPVLAVPGDRVRFTPAACLINGVPHARQPHMPAAGDLVVPENCWFLWPDLAITGNGRANSETADSLVLRLATVSQSQFVGIPFHRWFWRRQILQ